MTRFNLIYRWLCGIMMASAFSFAQAQDMEPISTSVAAASEAALPPSARSTSSQSLPSSSSTASVVEFDVSALKSLGYGAEVAEFFKQGSQFLPGQYDVTVVVNGSARYPATVTFGERGQLCLTPVLQKTLKLKAVDIHTASVDTQLTANADNVPRDDEARDANLDIECVDIVTVYPSAQVTPHPNTFTVDLLVSEADFDPQLRGDELTYGGFAVFSNYRVYGMQMKGTETQHFYQGQFESGVNWHNWLLRNNSSVSAGKNSTQYQFNETTLARSITPWRSMLQLGQINTQGSVFGGTPLNGVQLYSDAGLQADNALVVPITGVAESPATVEVMQNGRLLYRTLVPAGPFSLDRINGVVSGQPLQVTVLQEDGRQQQFSVVTTARASDQIISKPTYQVAVGQYRKRAGNEAIETPLIANLEGSVRYHQTDYLAGLQVSDRYQSVGGRLARQWGEQGHIGSSVGAQYAHNTDKQGQQWDASVSAALGPISLGLSSLYRTRDYPTLEETLQKTPTLERDNADNTATWWQKSSETQTANSVSLSAGNADWGRVSYALGYNHYYGDKSDTVLHTVSYAKRLGIVSFSASLQGGSDRDNRLFVNASVPLGRKASVSMQMQRYQDSTTLTSTLNHRPSNLWGYSVGVSRNDTQTRMNGSLNATTAYSQLTGSGSWTDENTHAMMLSASGAVVYADGLLATSAVPLGDTFGVLRVPGQSGVQINTLGGGTTVTNHWGTAAIPTLPVNRKTTVQLNTKNLPLNVRLDTTSFDVAVAKGTVISREVTATVMKQLLLGITLADGTPAPSGSSLVDEKGQLMGLVMGEGNAMLSNAQIGQPVRLRMANQRECVLSYPVPTHFDPNALYEEAAAICQ